MLHGDKRFLLKAGAEAQRATDFLLAAAAAGAGDTTTTPGAQPAAPDRAPAAA